MALPVIPLPTAEVEVDGQMVAVRGLSRAAAIRLSTQFTEATADDAEVFVLAQGTGVTEEEARQWLGSTDVETAAIVLNKIVELSALPKA